MLTAVQLRDTPAFKTCKKGKKRSMTAGRYAAGLGCLPVLKFHHAAKKNKSLKT